MDVLYTVNNKYLDIMLVSLCSLVDNSSNPDIRLHVVTSNFSQDDYKKLEDFSNLMGIDVSIYPLEDNPIDKYNIPDWHGTQIANARLFYPRIIGEKNSSLTNLLYLDADTIVVSDITSIERFKDSPVSACLDLSAFKAYKKSLGLNNYFNSGVIYFNIDKFLDLELENRILSFRRNSDVKLSYPDQDCFNIVLKDEISELPFEYNMPPYPYLFGNIGNRLFFNPALRDVSREEVVDASKRPVVLHSYGCANIKPWSINNINPFNGYFLEYIDKVNPDFELEKLSSFKGILANHPHIFNSLLLARSYIPNKLESKVRKLSLDSFHK